MKRILPIALLMISCAINSFAATKAAAPALPAKEAQGQKFEPAARLGVVNIERIMGECEQAKDISTDLQDEFMKRQDELRKRVTAFEEQQKAGKVTQADAAKKESEFNIDMRSIQVDIERRSGEAQQKLFAALEKASEVVAKELSLDVYAPKFLYAKESVDVTNKIIAEMNRAYRAEKQAAKFKEKQPVASAKSVGPKVAA